MPNTNLGPAITSNPQPQSSIGNITKSALLNLPSITPTALTASTTTQQSFAALGIGLIVGDQISAVTPPSYVAGITIVSAVVTAADTLQITWGNFTAGTPTPPAGVYQVEVNRAQSLASVPAGYMNSY